MYDVFISYAHADRAAAETIRDALSALNLKVFFDIEGIDGGADFPEIINRSLRSSKAVLACWSPLYFQRKWCMLECRFAADETPSILVPVAIQQLERRDIDVHFLYTNYFDLSGWNGATNDEAWVRTLTSLGKLLQRDLRKQITPPTPHDPRAEKLLSIAAADLLDQFSKFMMAISGGDEKSESAHQAQLYAAIARRLRTTPPEDEHFVSETQLGVERLKYAADQMRYLAKEEPGIEKQMLENAETFEQIAQYLKQDPYDSLPPITGH